MTDKTEQAVKKLMGKKEYSVAVRVTGYYNILVEAETEQEADSLAMSHNYTWDDLSYQGDVIVDDIVRIDYD